jgi:branched-chain amino acid transport system ATP-binding protein
MLDALSITVHYGRLAAVRGLSLAVRKGEIVCIAGPNGAGKSTTMLTIAGALHPTKGTILFDGQTISDCAPEEIARLGISLVPEGRHVFGGLSVEENLLIGSHLRSDKGQIIEQLESIYRIFPILRERRRQFGGKLSGGEQQQVAIARALMTRPRLLLIDEASLGLAPKIVNEVYRVILQLRDRGLTLLIVEQSIERALEVADRVLVMRSGAVVLEGRSDDFTDSAELRRAYFGGY